VTKVRDSWSKPYLVAQRLRLWVKELLSVKVLHTVPSI
jgi:hypothetical protein